MKTMKGMRMMEKRYSQFVCNDSVYNVVLCSMIYVHNCVDIVSYDDFNE